jgi:hypothetical protein
MIGIASSGKRRTAVAEPVKQTFERCADATLTEVRATYAQRGEEYSDTWALDNRSSAFTAHTLRELAGIEMTPEELRLVICAALIDVKESRLIGPYKRDTLVDSIAYRSLYAELRADLDRRTLVRHSSKEAKP